MTPKEHREVINDRYGVVALLSYATLAAVFFGRSVAGNFTSAHLGRGPDPSFLMWALVWWPYALVHHLNPFLCRIVWAPEGFNLAWSGSIPLAALITAPLTSAYGPVAAYNVLSLAAPVIAAWCAFLLCRSVCEQYWPAVVGGYIFGFSSYMLGQMVGGHLNLLFVFPAPIVAMLVWLRLGQRLGRLSFAVLAALAFTVQFLLSIELATTMVLFGALALAVTWCFASVEGRSQIVGLGPTIAGGVAVALCILSPYLYFLLAFGLPHGAINSPGAYSADLFNLIVPTPTVSVGALPAIADWGRRFGNIGEADAYLGIALIAIVVLYAFSHWNQRGARTLVTILAVVSILALGPRLHVAGMIAFGMPWKLFMHVPLLKSALPVRFMAYASLAAGVVAALWLADETVKPWLKGVLLVCLGVLSMPNQISNFFRAPVSTPRFFANDAYREYLRPGETIVALPYGITDGTMLWQAETEMYFKMAGGYTGITPHEFAGWPIVGAFSSQTWIPDAKAQLMTFMVAHDAYTVVVDDAHLALWAPLLTAIDSSPVRSGGVSVYRTQGAELAVYRGVSALEMERRCDSARMAALLSAANQYLAKGFELSQLTPMRVQQQGLLPPNWVTDPEVRTNNGLYLGPSDGDAIAVGVVGSYAAIEPIVARYRENAAQVFFPYPKVLKGVPAGDTFMRLLVMVFNRAGLPRAATQARDSRAY